MVSHLYNLNFSKSWSEATGVTYQVSTDDVRWKGLALQLTKSCFEDTNTWIEMLNQASDAESAEQKWLEVSNLALVINPNSDSVKVGDSLIPLDDLKELLQEWLMFIHPFNPQNEAANVSKYLTLPVTRIAFDDRFSLTKPYVDENWDFIKLRAELYYQQDIIGEIPYMISHFGPMYKTDVRELIDWEKIALLFNQELFQEIKKQQPAAVSAEGTSNGTLLVKDIEGKTIDIAYYHYINNRWQINFIGVNSELKTKIISVELKVPPPLNL